MTLPSTPKGRAMRQRLLRSAARELIHNDGRAELLGVARRARVSPGLPYRYFASKQALLAAVVGDLFDRFDEFVFEPDLSGHGDWAEREHVRVRRFVDFFYDEPIAELVLTTLSGGHEVIAAQRRRLEDQISVAAENIRRGQSEGVIPESIDSTLYAAMVMGGLVQAMLAALRAETRPQRADLAAELSSFIDRTLQIRSRLSAALEVDSGNPRPGDSDG